MTESSEQGASANAETDGSEGADDSGGDSAGDGIKLDVASPDGPPPNGCDDPDDPECTCEIDLYPPCDGDSQSPFAAMGLGCGEGVLVQAEITGSAAAVGVRAGFGQGGSFAPTEGERFAVIGSGYVAELDDESPTINDPFDLEFELDFPTFCNDDLDGLQTGTGPLDPEQVPLPIDPGLDDSQSLEGQLNQGSSVNDYTDLRIELEVPEGAESLSYDFAFLTTEYPAYLGSPYNDLFVGWIESENWTGNISFDDEGSPISLNAAFFDINDDDGNEADLAGTCMRYHGATRWLTTTTGVNPGESIHLVFAVFDLSDSILDSYVFLDNVRWGCDPSSQPGTEPVG